MNAELHIREEKRIFDFTTQLALTGKVIVNFYNRKDNDKLLRICTFDVRTVLLQTLGNLKQEGKTVFIDVEGKCEFKYGIEQEIVIKSTPLSCQREKTEHAEVPNKMPVSGDSK